MKVLKNSRNNSAPKDNNSTKNLFKLLVNWTHLKDNRNKIKINKNMHKKLFNSLMKKLIDWNNKTRNSEQIYQQKMSKYKA